VSLLVLLLACAPRDPGKPEIDADSAMDTPADSAASDSTDDSGPPRDTSLPAWAPTVDAPFVVTGCGFAVGAGDPAVVPDLDGDGVDDVLIVTDEPAIAGVWRVGSMDPAAPFWESPVHWDLVPLAGGLGVRAWPDLDGDGLAELIAFTAVDEARALLPDGSLSDALTDVPAVLVPWHDVDGDGVDEHLALFAEDGELRIVTADGVDPFGWTVHASLAVDGLGPYAARSRDDHDGDGMADIYVDAYGGGLLVSSAAIGGAAVDAVLATFGGAGVPVPLGDIDGGGVEDVAFTQGPGASGPVTILRGEAPADAVHVPSSVPSAFSTVGPDGAGGLAVWVGDGAVLRYPIAAALAGTERADAMSDGILSDRVYASAGSVYAGLYFVDGDRYATRPVLARLDAATLAGEAEVIGGGPGQGGQALAAQLDDLDGDGAIDWWQDDDGPVRYAALSPGTTVDLCDLPAVDHPDWTAASSAGDLDADGVPELVYWAEPHTVGAWNVRDGARWEGDFDGALRPLGCDLDQDGVGELTLDSFEAYVVDGVELLRQDAVAGAVMAAVRDDAVCLGDLDADGGSELADTWADGRVYGGRSVIAGTPRTLSTIEGPTIGRPVSLGDVDGDGLGDLGVLVSTRSVAGTCVVPGAWMASRASIDPAELEHCWEGTAWYGRVDLEQDGVYEVLRGSADGSLVAWSLVTGEGTTVWTPDVDARAEPLLTVLTDAFGPGRPAIVLGPEPVVVYALGAGG
jgi:hypothetical protein